MYVVGGFGGTGWETDRKSRRWMTAQVHAKNLHDFRLKLVYTPAALRRIAQERLPAEDDSGEWYAGLWLDRIDDCGSAARRDRNGLRVQTVTACCQAPCGVPSKRLSAHFDVAYQFLK